jgi:hypothetical protein
MAAQYIYVPFILYRFPAEPKKLTRAAVLV